MAENGIVHVKWVYTPADYFEEKTTDLLPDYEHTIENGVIIVKMDPEEYKNHSELIDKLHDQLLDVFRGAALVTQKPFNLNHAGEEIIYPSGRGDIFVHLATASIKAQAGRIDSVLTDTNGIVVTDTKQERVNKQNKLAKLAAKYGGIDEVADSILKSFEKALNNPKTVLVHLYEIRDSLKKKFKGEATAIKELGIILPKWDRLRRLSDVEPLNQGRHSGQHYGELRDATESELKQAREIAIEMVVAYLEYLERNTTKTP